MEENKHSLHHLCVSLIERDAHDEKSAYQRRKEQRKAAQDAYKHNKN